MCCLVERKRQIQKTQRSVAHAAWTASPSAALVCPPLHSLLAAQIKVLLLVTTGARGLGRLTVRCSGVLQQRDLITKHQFALHLIRDSAVIPNSLPQYEHPQETTTSAALGCLPAALRGWCWGSGQRSSAALLQPFSDRLLPPTSAPQVRCSTEGQAQRGRAQMTPHEAPNSTFSQHTSTPSKCALVFCDHTLSLQSDSITSHHHTF